MEVRASPGAQTEKQGQSRQRPCPATPHEAAERPGQADLQAIQASPELPRVAAHRRCQRKRYQKARGHGQEGFTPEIGRQHES